MPRHSCDQGLEESERSLLRTLESHGWFVIKVGATEEAPAFAYSLGLFQNFQQPEVILFGLDLDTMQTLINDLGELVRRGARFSVGDRCDELLEGYTCAFRPVSRGQAQDHMTYTHWYYCHIGFPSVQLVWPDMDGKLPWVEGFDERYRADQPDLSR